MKRPGLFMPAALAATAAVVFAASSTGAPSGKVLATGDAVPPCADIGKVAGTYDESGKTVSLKVTYRDATCAENVYDVFVYADRGDDRPIAGQGQNGNGSKKLAFSGLDVSKDSDGVVFGCAVTLQQTRGGTKVLDSWGYDDNWGCRGLRLRPGD